MEYNELKSIIDSMPIDSREAYIDEFKRQDLKFIDIALLYSNDLERLERQWNEYNEMTKPFRRKSDWIHLEYIGVDNETLYNTIKANMLKAPVHDDDLATPDNLDTNIDKYEDTLLMTESTFVPAADDIDYASVIRDRAPNLDRAVELAIQWCRETDFVMVLPPNSLEELEQMWEAFNSMIHKHKRVSDWKALELFGLSNYQLYIYYKENILANNDIEDIHPNLYSTDNDEYGGMDDIRIPFDKGSAIRSYINVAKHEASGAALGNLLMRLLRENTIDDSTYETILIKDIIESTIEDYNMQNSLNITIDHSNMPMFTPDEMIDMGVFGHEPMENYFNTIGDDIIAGDSTVLEWFKLYREVYNGLPITDKFDKINKDRVAKLESVYRTHTLEQIIEDKKLAQHILEMGWNPLYNFNDDLRIKANKRINCLIESQFGRSRVIDLEGFRTIDLSKFAIKEDSSVGIEGNDVKPIYLVFEEGFTAFSNAIKKTTKGVYSHAALSFDHTMQKIYSYGIEGSANGMKGGFIIENIKDKRKDAHMGVYTVFVNNDVWQKIHDNVTYLAQHAKETAYSYVNILTMVFKIPYEKSNNLICSQFVDRMLKLAGIDVTGKPSSLVDPNFLHRVSKSAKDIYKLFEGRVKSFSPKVLYNRTIGLLNKISKYKVGSTISENVINESIFYYDSLNALNEIYESNDIKDPIVRKIYETFYMPCMEAKEIPIRFDDKGDVLIDNFKLDYKAEYAKSHKLLQQYEKAKNYEGMKSELAKLWMMNVSIEKKIRNSRFNKSRVKYLQDAKALILNDFKKYLNMVIEKHDKEFDFEEYFVNSRYYDQTYRVGKDTIKHTINLIKTVI